LNDQAELLTGLALRAVAERYAMAIDRGDGELFAAQFTPDGVFESPHGPLEGREQIATVPATLKRLFDRTHHGVVGLVPVIDGDTAVAETYSYSRHYYRDAGGAEHCYEMTLRYDDRFIRTNGIWLIAHRVLVVVGDATYQTAGWRF